MQKWEALCYTNIICCNNTKYIGRLEVNQVSRQRPGDKVKSALKYTIWLKIQIAIYTAVVSYYY
jgi:hypothetical protein